MSNLNIPLIEREGSTSKNCKMMFVLAFIIVAILIISYKCAEHKYTFDDIHNPDADSCIPYDPGNSDIINKQNLNEPVRAQYISLVNTNRRNLPVEKIVVICADRRIIPIKTNDAQTNKLGKMGIIMNYRLPREEEIVQVIIDIDTLHPSKKNMITTQVELKDKNHMRVWHNAKTLPTDTRYIYVHMVKPNIVYGPLNQSACKI
jgi:hypothetical protein